MVIAPNKCISWNRAAYEHKTLADTVSIMKSQQVCITSTKKENCLNYENFIDRYIYLAFKVF